MMTFESFLQKMACLDEFCRSLTCDVSKVCSKRDLTWIFPNVSKDFISNKITLSLQVKQVQWDFLV